MSVPKGNTNSTEAQESKEDFGQCPWPNRTRSNPNCSELLFLPNSHGNIVPKQITAFDEKYVLHCLDLLHNCALRATNLPNMTTKLAVESPLVTRGQSLINIFGSPLLQKFDSDFGRKQLLQPVCSNLPKPEKGIYESPRHRRLVSMSSTTTTCSDKSSSSSGSANSFQGLLTCKWKDGLPNHVFTVDDKMEEVYIASLSRTGPNDDCHDKGSDYIYTFCLRKKDAKLQSVGTMKVSTSITLSSNHSSEVRETQFILSLKDPTDEIQIRNNDHKMSKRLKSKVAKVFKSSHSSKQRPGSSFSKSSPIFEDSPLHPSEHEDHASCMSYNRAPNLELGAVIVRDECRNREEEDLGGWGLKFLNKLGKDSSVKPILSEPLTSLDVLIPAGLHGGPGPSSIVERWASGGHCDCGGWDIGCPLSILTMGPSSVNANSSVVVDSFGECSSVDLFMQGSKEGVPTFKMANIHNGLYYIQFQSSLSNFQTFAIAVAIIHSRSPVLRSRVCST